MPAYSEMLAKCEKIKRYDLVTMVYRGQVLELYWTVPTGEPNNTAKVVTGSTPSGMEVQHISSNLHEAKERVLEALMQQVDATLDPDAQVKRFADAVRSGM